MPPKAGKKDTKNIKSKDPKLEPDEQVKLTEVQECGLFEAYEYIIKNLLKNITENKDPKFNIYEFACNRLIKFEPKFKIQQKIKKRNEKYLNYDLAKKQKEEQEKKEIEMYQNKFKKAKNNGANNENAKNNSLKDNKKSEKADIDKKVNNDKPKKK